jgi:hypothetical protein
MHEKEAQLNNLWNPKIVKISKRLDDKLNNYQKLLQLASPENIDQILLSHKHLILQHQNNNMSFEYNVIKTFVNFSKVPVSCVQKKLNISAESFDDNIRLFISAINESDESILNKFVLTSEGRILSEEEAKNFISFVRTEIR